MFYCPTPGYSAFILGVGKIGFGSGSGQPDRVSGYSGCANIDPNITRTYNPTRSDPIYIRIGSDRVKNRVEFGLNRFELKMDHIKFESN